MAGGWLAWRWSMILGWIPLVLLLWNPTSCLLMVFFLSSQAISAARSIWSPGVWKRNRIFAWIGSSVHTQWLSGGIPHNSVGRYETHVRFG
ncbi:hypothetical protein B0T25DRAFT_547872 [Lasiosphaeria hispida]|uniref:Uncharacterized protein n=1 Tax=Lasiosphaeria hispida TaxID=260671 RepID=A0AAJ0HEM1_9PEZI|nr:hypothetical protein B0T25DRAFT_547872 [Lasiosphaeria hispida]